MKFVSKTLLVCCLHLLPVLCAVLYYVVHVELHSDVLSGL